MDFQKQLDKLVIKEILIPFIISLVIIAADLVNGFHLSIFLPIVFTTLIVSVFEFNKQYLIRIEKADNGELKLTYYNFLDKIVNETISKKQLDSYKTNKSQKGLTLLFEDNRKLKLHFAKGITEYQL